ncbi:MAG: HAD family hydrolase [Pseudomonadota bacterium]
MSLPLCLWSGPRNISTAMMRSFGARSDTVCWDEPFFAAFLKQTGLDHPGREETLEQSETDAEEVATRILAPVTVDYHFQKHMAHHMLDGMPMDWVAHARHVLLLRHPAKVIASYQKGRAHFTADDLGFGALRRLVEQLRNLRGRTPFIINSDDILLDPESALTAICEQGFGIPFDKAMLSWEAGPRPEDGPWAPYWYENVIASTGFGSPSQAIPEVSPAYQDTFETCLEDYKALKAMAWSG